LKGIIGYTALEMLGEGRGSHPGELRYLRGIKGDPISPDQIPQYQALQHGVAFGLTISTPKAGAGGTVSSAIMIASLIFASEG
jgi:hypothetical protein